MKMTKEIPLLGLVILLISALVLTGCGKIPTNIPHARDLCLSQSKDLYKLECWLFPEPIPHDEFSKEYDPYPKYASSAYETRYSRAFYSHYPIDIHNTHLELAPGFCLENDVRVYRSVEKAKEGFADMRIPKFAFDSSILGIPGIEWEIAPMGDESKAWFYADEVLDDRREVMMKQIDAELYFRKGCVISSIEVKTWGGNFKETESFLLDVAQLSETKISEALVLP